MRFILTIVLALVAAAPLRAEPLEGYVVATGAPLTDVDALVAALKEADVIVIGEIHDNPRHQALQASLIRALSPDGVAFEMVKQAKTEAVNAALAEGELADFPNLTRYAEPLAATPPGHVVGAGQPRERVIRAMQSSAAAAFDGDAARFGLETPFPPELQKEVEAELFASHCDALPKDMLPGMAEAQRLRDAAFAAAALRARNRGLSILIAGNGHARTDRGVPAILRHAEPDLKVIAIAQIEREVDGPPDPDASPYDIVILTDPAERDDPCAQFEKTE